MKKSIEIPDKYVSDMKKEAIDKGFSTFKAFLDHEMHIACIRVHGERRKDDLY